MPFMSLVGASSAHLLPARDFSPPPTRSPVCALSELLCSLSRRDSPPPRPVPPPRHSHHPTPHTTPTHHHPPSRHACARAPSSPRTLRLARKCKKSERARAQEETTTARQWRGRMTRAKWAGRTNKLRRRRRRLAVWARWEAIRKQRVALRWVAKQGRRTRRSASDSIGQHGVQGWWV